MRFLTALILAVLGGMLVLFLSVRNIPQGVRSVLRDEIQAERRLPMQKKTTTFECTINGVRVTQTVTTERGQNEAMAAWCQRHSNAVAAAMDECD